SEEYRGGLDATLDKVRARVADGWQVVIAAAGTGSAERFREQCADADIPARVHTVHDAEPGVVSVVPQLTSAGWSSVGARVLVVSETDLTGRRTAAAGPKVRV